MPVLSLACHLPHNTPNIPSRYNNEQTTKQTKAINNSYIYISHVNVTQTVPDISPLMPMHQDPLLVHNVYVKYIYSHRPLYINGTRLGERRADRFCYANEPISVHCPSFGSLPMCPDRLRLPSWLTIPAETGLGQLSQGSRYGSHHAPFHAFLETSWRIGNETLSTL